MLTALIIDDARVVRMVSRKIFEDLGFSVVEAENGAVGLEKIAAHAPNVVLLDWNMPVMDGITCLTNLRTNKTLPQPKVILCTTENDFDHITAALNAGADEYIMKPFDSDIVRDKLQQLGLV